MADLEVFLQLLPALLDRGADEPHLHVDGHLRGDGPRELHVVLLDNGRTDVLRDPIGRQALACIRCSCLSSVCPVYSRTGGHAYESVYPGPIGAILTPQLQGVDRAASLPYASTLCGACYEVCPVKINIPEVLVHLRRARGPEQAREGQRLDPEALAMEAGPRLRQQEAYERAPSAPDASRMSTAGP